MKRLLLTLLLLATAIPAHAALGRSDGADLVFGGPGAGPGQFTVVRDMLFDAAGNLWVLESNGPIIGFNMKDSYDGLARVQKFDANGKFIAQYPLGDDIPAVRRGGPWQLAVDRSGNFAITLPTLNKVRIFAPDGKLLRDVPLPDCQTVAAWNVNGANCFAVITYKRVNINREWVESGGEEIWLVDPAAGEPRPLKLSQPVRGAKDVAVGKDGTLYVLADVRQIYQINTEGKIIRVLGGGTTGTYVAMDGSEATSSVAVDSAGNVYSVAGGNPASIAKYMADGKTVLLRRGQFKWSDTWNGGFAILLAVDKSDRLWAAATKLVDPAKEKRYHFQPAIMRTLPDFLLPTARGVKVNDARLLGLRGTITGSVPLDVSYDLAPLKAELVIAPANRVVDKIDVTLSVYDWRRKLVNTTKSALVLEDGVEARCGIGFTPPRYGWYTVRAELATGGDTLVSYGHHFIVTPRYANIPELKPEETNGSWEDPARQMFAGQPNYRLHVTGKDAEAVKKSLPAFAKKIETAQAAGTTLFVQLAGSNTELVADRVRPALEAMKGKVKYVELCNEPNFFFKTTEYVERATEIYNLVKQIDPEMQVLGPAVCGMQLPWHEAFFKAGGAKTYDIFSTHDYEGHESITPEHWIWKVGELRKMMAKYGAADRPFWQTERAISAIRGAGLQATQQAVRVTLRYDLLESLGVPAEHNNHYYLNEGGYSTVPSYMWAKDAGPQPAALAMRTRYSQTKDRAFTGTLDFGPGGNQLFFGLCYAPRAGASGVGLDGGVLTLRNLGDNDRTQVFTVRGGVSLKVMDSWGNVATVPVQNGRATLTLSQMPCYVVLAPGQQVQPEPLRFERNLAAAAVVSYAGTANNDIALLTNGILETYHGDNPNGGTDGRNIWRGEPVTPDKPGVIDLKWANARTFDSALLSSPRADNIFCSLLDFDLQIPAGDAWKTIAEVRTDTPETYAVEMGDAIGVQFQLDDNLRYTQFPAVTSDRLRVVVRRMSYGYDGDAKANVLVRRLLSSPPQPFLMLREIQVFASPAPVHVNATGAGEVRHARADRETIRVAVSAAADFKGTVVPAAPAGWSVQPPSAPVTAVGGKPAALTFTVTPPAQIAPGQTVIDFALRAENGAIVSADGAVLRYASPLALTAAMPAPAATGPQPFSLKVKNTGAVPVGGSVRLTLKGNNAPAPVDQALATLQPDEERLVTFEVPGVKLANQRWQAAYQVTVDGIVQSVEQNLAARQWLVVGPFENDLDKEFGPEAGVKPAQGFTDMVGEQQKWRTVSSDTSGLVDLTRAFDKKEDVSAYAAVWVTSPTARRALLQSGTDDGGKVWFNGKQVISQATVRGARPAQDVVEVDLKAGANLVLLKITQSQGGWGFFFDLADVKTGKPIENLIYTTTPP